jgi:hypothetical protein
MEKMMKKRLLGILLSLALMMTMMPALAFAQDEPDAENTETKDVAAEEVPVSGEVQYPLWIGKTQVTSENLSGQGWSYDADSNTLTLDGYSNDEESHSWKSGYSDYSAAICAEDDLTIKLEGDNTAINPAYFEDYLYGIYGKKHLTFIGKGKLNTGSEGYGIYVEDGDLEINDGILNVSGEDEEGICAYDGDMTVNGGTVTARSEDEEGIDVEGRLTINGGKVESASEDDDGLLTRYLEINGGFLVPYKCS